MCLQGSCSQPQAPPVLPEQSQSAPLDFSHLKTQTHIIIQLQDTHNMPLPGSETYALI